MRHRLVWLLVVLLCVVGVEFFILTHLKHPAPQSASRTITPSPTASSSDQTAATSWAPGAIGFSTSEQYGTVSAVLVRVARVEPNEFWGELNDATQVRFSYDEQTEYLDRQETGSVPVVRQQPVGRFPLEPGRVYLVEWRGKSTQNIQVWRISRLIL